MDKELTARQRRAVIAIVTSDSMVEACQIAGVAERTIRRWITQEAFRAELAKIENDMLERATGRLTALQERAIRALQGCLESQNESIRLRACHTVLDYSMRYREQYRIETRLPQN